MPLGWGRLEWAGAAAIVLLILALASIWRARGYSRRARIVWTVVVVVLPIVGPLAWLAAGREPGSGRRAP